MKEQSSTDISLLIHARIFSGEHIDYSGYGVLPIAISASTFILASPHNADEIVFQNANTIFK